MSQKFHKHFTALPQIESAKPEIEIHTLTQSPAGRSRFQAGRSRFPAGRQNFVQLCDTICAKLGRFNFDILIPHCNNPTQGNKWPHFIWLIIVYFIRQSLDFRQDGLDLKQYGLDLRKFGLDFRQGGSGMAVSISGRSENNKIGAKCSAKADSYPRP